MLKAKGQVGTLVKIISILLSLLLLAACQGGDVEVDATPVEEETPAEAVEQATETISEEPAGEESEPGAPIPLGFVGVLSGPSALNGELSRDGALLAIEEINAEGGVSVPGAGQRPLELIVEDDTGSPDAAVNAVSKLVFEDEVFAILGPDFGNVVVATLQICRETGALQIYSTLSSATTQPDVYCETSFRNRSSDVYWARALVDYLVEELGHTKIATSYQNFEFGITGNDMVVQRLAEHDIEPIVTVSHEFGDTDLTPSAADIVDSEAEVVINWGLQGPQATLLQELRNLGWEGMLAGPTVDQIFTSIAGDLANGSIGAQNWVYTVEDEKSQTFTENYQEEFGRLPGSHSVGYYDAVYLIKDAIENSGMDTGAVVNYISNLEEWEATQGTYTPAKLSDGELTTIVRIVRIEGEEPIAIKTVDFVGE